MRWVPIRAVGILTVVSPTLAPPPAPGQDAAPAKPAAAPSAEVLYNGIVLPTPWPPPETLPLEPVTPPYLVSPPPVIPIDVGRQLLVDDFLVESTTLHRMFHLARFHDLNPVLKPDQPWESRTEHETERGPGAMVFSDGVWYDPADALFKMWYMAGAFAGTGYATSRDGLHWDKPRLDVVPGTNLVQQGWRDSSVIWLDPEAEPRQRFKMAFTDDAFRHGGGQELSTSPDGIHWTPPVRSGPVGDRSTIFYNPFRKRWVFSVRGKIKIPEYARMRYYWEAADFLTGAGWKAGEPALWTRADLRDPQRADLKRQPELYNLDCVAYESLLLGLFSIWRGQHKDRPKHNDVCVGFSRDGFHWDRPDRRAFVPVSERKGDWNWGNVQSAGGCCLVVGDQLYFYVSGRAGVPGSFDSGVCTTGLATLRRDGFASLDAGDEEGTLTTRPVTFTGRRLFVNAATAAADRPARAAGAEAVGGRLEAEVIGVDGKVVEPFSRANSLPFSGDATLAEMRWKEAEDLAPLAGRPVRFRFHLLRGSLYAFWVSPDESGASRGYVAAGGPGYTGPVDTVGRAALAGQR